MPCFDKLRWCIRILKIKVQQERNTKAETLQEVFLCGFGPPSLVVLTVRNTLKLGHTKFCTPRVVQFGFFFVPCLCLCSFHPFAIWGEGDVWGSWLFLQVQHAATLRKPTALHETTRTAVSPWDQTNCCRFPDVSSSGVAGCEITPLRNIMRHTWHPGEEKRHAKLVAARKHLAGLKCALILFSSNVILLPVFCFCFFEIHS